MSGTTFKCNYTQEKWCVTGPKFKKPNKSNKTQKTTGLVFICKKRFFPTLRRTPPGVPW